MILRDIFILSSLAVIASAVYLGADIRFEEQWVLYEALRTTASIIFAVVGVWLAIVYPDRLKNPFGKSSSDPVYQRGFQQLFSPVISSVFILSIVLFVGLLASILKQIDFVKPYTQIFRQVSVGLLAGLTMWQIYTVLSVLVPLLNILDKNKQDSHANNIIDTLKGKSD